MKEFIWYQKKFLSVHLSDIFFLNLLKKFDIIIIRKLNGIDVFTMVYTFSDFHCIVK